MGVPCAIPENSTGRAHYGKMDSHRNLFSGEVDTGKRMQKWLPVE